jgi:RND family efflux transporter MFP subunit
MLRKPLFWIGLVIVLALAGGGYYYYTTTLAKPKAVVSQTLQTYRVQRGNLVISAGGTGTLIPAAIIDVAFAKSGVLAEVNVQVGDKVKAGDILAKQGNLDSLQLTVANDQLSVLTAQQTLDDLYANLEADRATAQAALVTAEKEVTNTSYYRDIYQTQRCDPAAITLYYGDYTLAQIAYDKLNNDFQANYVAYAESDPRRINAYSKLYAAQQTMLSAQRTYNYCTGRTDTWTTTDLSNQASVAQATYNAAKAKVELLKNGPDPMKLAQAQAKLDSAKRQLAISQKSITDTVLYAPIDGVVTAVNAQVGETASGTFITIADKFHPMIQTYMDETDMDKIGLKYEVNVTFDALAGKTFTGTVVQIDPALATVSGVQYVKAQVKLDEKSALVVQNLPTGMNAAVDVVGGKANNALLVPIEALRQLGTDEYAIFVMGSDGKLKLTPVTIGLQSVTQAEVLTGLKEGDTISLGSTTSTSASTLGSTTSGAASSGTRQ